VAFLPLVLAYPFVLGLPPVLTLRAISLALPGVLILQELACFSAGCCTGVPTDLPWGVEFPANSLCPTPGVPVHPVPLYDVLFAIGISVVVATMDRFAAARAFLFPVFVGMFGLNRLITDMFLPQFNGTLSLRQYLAGGATLACAAVMLIGRNPWRRFVGDTGSTDAS
jgi:phosphatidylglycerol:prolipoprotein diacylglycerol transferase